MIVSSTMKGRKRERELGTIPPFTVSPFHPCNAA